MDAAAIYRRSRQRVMELVASLPPDGAATPVPACPPWTVHAVVSHLAGASVDFQEGRTEGAPSPAWTQRQVDERRERSIDDVLAEWAEAAPGFEAMIAAVPGVAVAAMDVLTHEWDLRGALRRPGDKADDDIDAVLQRVVGGFGGRMTAAGVAPLRVRAGVDEWILGGGDAAPTTTLTAEPYELFRMAFGRRSVAQMRAYDWQGDPAPYVPLLTVFPPSRADLSE
jgi:uncharacterized protein (TIGR03083 family)